MIVHTMTEEELHKEVNLDYLNVFNYSNYQDNKFRRLVIKAKKFPVRMNLLYRSIRKNKWIILFEGRSKKEIGDLCRITFVCYYDSPHGNYAIMPTFTNGNQHLIFYPPHFFSRYAERCDIDLFGVELMKKYFIDNNSYVYDLKHKMISENSYIQEVYGSSSDGVALGIMSVNNNVLFKTFITYDMTKGEQIEKFASNEMLRKEIHDV